MNKKRIYAAGPISGLTYDQAANGWRARLMELLPEFEIMSPMRGKEFLASKEGKLFGAYDEHPISTKAGILGRDRNDVKTCDLMVACFLEDEGHTSMGTSMEFGWADAWRKPVILVAEKDNLHRMHPMLNGASTYTVETLEEAADLARLLLTPSAKVRRTTLWNALPGRKALRLRLVDINNRQGRPQVSVDVDVLDMESGEPIYIIGRVDLNGFDHAITLKLDAEAEVDV